MKKYIFLLTVFLFGQNSLSNQQPKRELKIYRTEIHPGAAVCFVGGATSLMGSAFFVLLSRYDSALSDRRPTFLFGVMPTSFAMGLFVMGRKEQRKWNKKRNKPILIFDEEGFTYEKSMGWPRERQDVRYLWKNVVSHWVSKVVDEYGDVIKEHWNYHIEGVDDIVSINALELNIPKNLQARVQSLRQGRIRALSA